MKNNMVARRAQQYGMSVADYERRETERREFQERFKDEYARVKDLLIDYKGYTKIRDVDTAVVTAKVIFDAMAEELLKIRAEISEEEYYKDNGVLELFERLASVFIIDEMETAEQIERLK